MRLGINQFNLFPEIGDIDTNTVPQLAAFCREHGFGAIAAPPKWQDWDIEHCRDFGAACHEANIVIGEAGYWRNMLRCEGEELDEHIANVRALLRKADAGRVGCIVSLVGSFGDGRGSVAQHPDNRGPKAKAKFREICLRIVDGLDLDHTTYAIEPWQNTFFWKPADIADFLDELNHPKVQLHLDQMNMIHPDRYFDTTAVIEETFALLGNRVASIHAKDLKWHDGSLYIHIDEVAVGDGVMDYDTYLQKIDGLHPDIPLYTEHWKTREQYDLAVERLKAAAVSAGVEYIAC